MACVTFFDWLFLLFTKRLLAKLLLGRLESEKFSEFKTGAGVTVVILCLTSEEIFSFIGLSFLTFIVESTLAALTF